MKKSIKYAGIAAATLLAVAPVAAPVVSTTTTVQAADATYTTTNDASYWRNQFNDYTTKAADDPLVLSSDDYGDLSEKTVKPSDLTAEANTLIVKAMTNNVLANNTFVNGGTDAKITSVEATKIGSKDNLTYNDLTQTLNNHLGDGVTVTIDYSYKTDADTTKTDSVSFNVNFDNSTTENEETTKAALTFTTPISVAANSKTAYTQLDSSVSDTSIKDQDGNELVGNSKQVASVTPTVNYFTTLKAAEDSTRAAGDATFKTAGQFDADATYFQRVTVTAVAGSSLDTYLKNQANTADGSYTINGTSYANTNNGYITAGTAASSEGANDATGSTITFVRTINVGSAEAADWTTEDVKGVVTTKSDSAYYTLNNDDNNTIANRALAKNSAWITDKKRTNSNGDVQYRVATGEWIDANNVTFSDGSNSGSGTTEGAYTDVKDINGKVSLAGPSSFIYMLYNDNGENVTNRNIAGDSDWYTDKQATNADGTTVYRVATGEWVQAGIGVTYSAY